MSLSSTIRIRGRCGALGEFRGLAKHEVSDRGELRLLQLSEYSDLGEVRLLAVPNELESQEWNPIFNGKVHQNSDPSPRTEEAPTDPFIASASTLEIDRPNPDPPKEAGEIPCTNGVNSFFSISGLIPIPESLTEKRNI